MVRDGQLFGAGPGTTLDRPVAQTSIAKLATFDIESVICYHGGMFRDHVMERLSELAAEGGITLAIFQNHCLDDSFNEHRILSKQELKQLEQCDESDRQGKDTQHLGGYPPTLLLRGETPACFLRRQ
jgi:hypothetical protein